MHWSVSHAGYFPTYMAIEIQDLI